MAASIPQHKVRLVEATAFLLATFTTCALGARVAPRFLVAPTETDMMVTALTKTKNFTKILPLMQKSGTGGTFLVKLQSFLPTSNVTIFLPTDTAMASLSSGNVTKLNTDFNFLQAVLMFEVLGQKLSYSQLLSLKLGATVLTKWKNQAITMTSQVGADVTISPLGQTVKSKITQREVYLSTSGAITVHGMDTVLFPTYP